MDSNFDGIKDWQEYASDIALEPYSPDSPNDFSNDPDHLVPNAYYGVTTLNHLLINEVFFDPITSPGVPPSQLTADWIELYNPTGADISINGWKLEATVKAGANPPATTTWTVPASPVITVPHGGFRVVNANASTSVGGAVSPNASFSLEGATLQSLQLKNAASTQIDQFILANVPGAAGHSQPFDCARWLGNPSQWVIPVSKNGTRGAHNQILAHPLDQWTLDPAQLIPNAYYGRFTAPILNEAQFASTGDVTTLDGEHPDWVELYNPTGATVSLQGWSLRDNTSPSTKIWTFPVDAGRTDLSLAPNEYRLVYCSGKTPVQADNSDSASVTFTGTWTSATTGTAFLGSDYRHDNNAAKGTKTAQFAPDLPKTGRYWVYLRWPTTPGGASTVPVEIRSLAGITTGSVLQQGASGPWFALGDFDFSAGRNAATGAVVVKNTGTTGLVFADAVLFSPYPITEWHATFKLDLDSPSTIDLKRPDNTVAHTLGDPLALPSFGTPPQAGISLGLWPDRFASNPANALALRYFSDSTPGAPNGSASGAVSLTPAPEFVTPAGAALHGGVFSGTTLQVALQCLAAPDAFIFYTTNGAAPTDQSEIYSSPLSVSRTTIVRAIAIRPGALPSRPVTASFLFKESVLGTAPQGTTPTDFQGALDAQNQFIGLLYGYPRFTDRQRRPIYGTEFYEFDFAMNAADVSLNKNALLGELSGLPTISLVTSVNDGFNRNALGIYSHASFNPGEAPGSVEFIGFPGQTYRSENCGIEVAGGSSMEERETPKHSLEIQFRKSYSLSGDGKFTASLFPAIPYDQGRTVTKFDKLRLRTPLQNSWPIRAEGDGNFAADPAKATYCNEQWGRDTQAAMGHLTPRMRWTHVYLNGIYWGVYALSEVVTQDFLSEHDKARNNVSGELAGQFAEENYDVIGGEGNLRQGGPRANVYAIHAEWQALIAETNYAVVEQQVDLDNYIDYLLVNFFMANRDWEANDWRAARNRHPAAPDHKWRFYVWDCDAAFTQESSGTSRLDLPYFDVAAIHANFRYYPPYQRKLASHMKQHLLDPSGGFSPNGGTFNSTTRYQSAMNSFQLGLFSESARWGDVKLPPSHTASFGLTDWQTNTGFVLNAFLPAQRAAFLTDAPDFGLLVTPTVNEMNQGPEVTLTVPGGTAQPFSGGAAPLNSVLTLSAPNKSIRYFLDFAGDGHDPKNGGAAAATTQKTWMLDQTLQDNYGSVEISARTLTGSTWSGLTRIQLEIQ